MGDPNSVCVLHGEIDRQLNELNRHIGQVSGRVVKVETLVEETNAQLADIYDQQAKIISTLNKMQLASQHQRGYIAGLAAGSGAMAYGVIWLIEHYLLLPRGG